MANSHRDHHSEQEVEKKKFDVGAAEFSVDAGSPLPEGYGDNRLVIMSRDPYWFFAYWEITHERAEAVRVAHGRDSWDKAVLVLRVYDLGDSPQTPIDSADHFDVEVQKFARQWYVQVLNAGHVYVADLGLRWPDGKFVSLFRSNYIRQPSGRVSDLIDSQWMSVGVTSEEWELMARMSIGAGSSKGASGEVAKGMALRWEFLRSVFSGSVSSWPGSKTLLGATPPQEVPKP
jgi:hypothetical protein